jgi:hypothetical protein
MVVSFFVDCGRWSAYKGIDSKVKASGEVQPTGCGTGVTGCGTGVTGCGSGVTGCGSGVTGCGGGINQGDRRHNELTSSNILKPRSEYANHAVNFSMGATYSIPASDKIPGLSDINIGAKYSNISMPVNYDYASQINLSELDATALDLSVEAHSKKHAISEALSLSFSGGMTYNFMVRDGYWKASDTPENSAGIRDFNVNNNMTLDNLEMTVGYKYAKSDFDLLANEKGRSHYVTGGVSYNMGSSKRISIPMGISGEMNLNNGDYIIGAGVGVKYKSVTLSVNTEINSDNVSVYPQLNFKI